MCTCMYVYVMHVSVCVCVCVCVCRHVRVCTCMSAHVWVSPCVYMSVENPAYAFVFFHMQGCMHGLRAPLRPHACWICECVLCDSQPLSPRLFVTMWFFHVQVVAGSMYTYFFLSSSSWLDQFFVGFTPSPQKRMLLYECTCFGVCC